MNESHLREDDEMRDTENIYRRKCITSNYTNSTREVNKMDVDSRLVENRYNKH